MKKKRFEGHFAYKKDVGKVRVSNEDEAIVMVNSDGDLLMIVADGMGGSKKGDYASKEVIRQFEESFRNKKKFSSRFSIIRFISKNLKIINKELYKLGDENPQYKGLGTTCVIAFLYKDKLIVASCGDSRCYLLSKKEFKQINEDETYVTYLYNSGQIKENEMKTHPARHLLTNAVGIYPSISFEIKTLKYNEESILLCSDGLFNNVKIPDIENILRTDDDVETKVDSLISVANYNGGSDNISVALWECLK